MYRVDITNSQSCLKLDDAYLRDVVTRTLADERVASATIGLQVVDNKTIRDLNRRHLAHDYDTDVLSFLLETIAAPERDDARGSTPLRGAGKHIEGEIVVSAEMAVDRAVEFGWRPEDELTLYVVHGLLHLAGYDDTDAAESAVMRQRESEILAHWNLTPVRAGT